MDEKERQLALRYFTAQNPNPERSGCPSKHILRTIAKGKLDPRSDWYSHLTTCSPCVLEAEQFRTTARRHRLLWSATAAASLLIAIASIAWWSRSAREQPRVARDLVSSPLPQLPSPTPPAPPESVQPSNAKGSAAAESVEMAAVTVDLTAFAPFRGTDQTITPPIPEIKVSRNDLIIILPPASAQGSYNAQIVDNTWRVVLPLPDGRARRDAAGRTVLRVENCDFRYLAPGRYSLALRAPGQDWRLFAIAVKT